MKGVLMAVLLSAFVWPGAGQMYNREIRKGFLLVGLTVLLCISFLVGAEMEIIKRLPADAANIDMAQARAIIEEVLRQNSTHVVAFNLLMFAAWIYGVVDAYLGAKDRAVPPPDDASARPGV